MAVTDWIDKTFLEEILETEVESFQVKPLGESNDFFTSTLNRVTVNLKSGKTEHLIIKKVIEGEGEDGKLFAESTMFLRECYMYNFILPKLQKLLEKAFPGKEGLDLFSFSRYNIFHSQNS